MALVPTADVIGLLPPGHDGGKGVMFASNGVNAMTGIPSRIKDQNRIKDLLRILDFYAAPFGSEERIFLDYGTEGTHFTMQNGAPVTNDLFNAEKGDFQNLMYGPYVLYSPVPGVAAYVQDMVRQLVEIGVDNPVISAYSETFASRSGELAQLIDDRVTSIVTGRAPLSSYDQLVADWRSRAGDQMRKEYQDFLAGRS
jgi:putative aldouronate transport system substrate-binding protein